MASVQTIYFLQVSLTEVNRYTFKKNIHHQIKFGSSSMEATLTGKNSLSTPRANYISKTVDPFEKGLICQGSNFFPAVRPTLEKEEK